MTATRSLSVPATPAGSPSSKLRRESASSVRLPTVSRPGLLPGASVPPEFTIIAPLMLPEPPRVPPEFTVTAELVSEPFIASVPPETVVAPL